jgi:hypothetical protein
MRRSIVMICLAAALVIAKVEGISAQAFSDKQAFDARSSFLCRLATQSTVPKWDLRYPNSIVEVKRRGYSASQCFTLAHPIAASRQPSPEKGTCAPWQNIPRGLRQHLKPGDLSEWSCARDEAARAQTRRELERGKKRDLAICRAAVSII